ncbi:MAG: tetratricopeptide repeat protein [Bacillota bacterium]
MYWIFVRSPWARMKDRVNRSSFWYLSSRFYRLIGAETRALNLLEAVLKKVPKRADLHLEAGKLYLHRGQLDRAAWHLSRANYGFDTGNFIAWLEETTLNDDKEILGDRARIFCALGDWHLQAGEPEKALTMYDRAMLAGRNVGISVLNNRGLALMQLGRMREAKVHFEQARAYGSNAELEFNSGLLYSKLGQHREAVDCYESAQRHGFNSVELLNNKGFSLFHLRRYEEAVLCHELARKLAPADPTVLANLAACYEVTEQYTKAVSVYYAALKYAPNDAALHNNLAVCLVKLQKFADALPHHDRALALVPQNTVYHANRAICLGHLGNAEEATKIFQHLLAKDPRNTLLWGLYGDFLAQLQRMDEAVDAYNLSLGLVDPGAA